MGTGEIPILEDGYIFIILPRVYYHWILRLQTLGVTSTGIEIIDYHMRHVLRHCGGPIGPKHMCHGR